MAEDFLEHEIFYLHKSQLEKATKCAINIGPVELSATSSTCIFHLLEIGMTRQQELQL